MTIVYVGGPIDYSLKNPIDSFDEMVSIITETLGEDTLLFNPLKAFSNANKTEDKGSYEFIFDINMNALKNSDLAVFKVDDSPSFGVPIEIYVCNKHRIPCIVWYQRKARPGIYLKHLCNNIAMSKEEVTAMLLKLKSSMPIAE